MTDDRRDLLIKAALAPRPTLAAPDDLARSISAAVRVTPQRRRWFGRPAVLRDRQLAMIFVVAALVLAAIVAFAVASRQTAPLPGVLGYHGPPSRTGVMPGPVPTGTPVSRWMARLGGSVSVLGMPLVVDRTVLVGDGSGTVTALEESSGIVRWKASVDRPGSLSIVVIGKIVVAGSERGTLVAMDRAAGAPLWTTHLGSGTALSVAGDGGTVIVTSAAGDVTRVDPATGAVVWAFRVGGPILRGVAISGDVGLVGDGSGRVTAFRITTGASIWTRELGSGEINTPAIGGDAAYVAHGFADHSPAVLVVLDLSSGVDRWRWTLPNNGRLFLGAREP